MATENVDFRLTAKNETRSAFDDAKKGLESLAGSVGKVRGALAAIGATAVAAELAQMIHQQIEATARYKDLAEMAGTTAERISGFEIPARLAGKSLDDVAGAVAKLGKSIGEARLGDVGKASLFQALGINVDDGRDAALVMVDVAKALSGMTDQTVAGKVASDLIGKSFAEARGWMREVAEQGTIVGRVTNEQAEEANRYQQQLVRLKVASEDYQRHIAMELLPHLNLVVDAMVRGQKEGGGFMSVIAGIQTWLTGDDAHKANVEIFELTDRRLGLEQKIAELKKEQEQGVPAMPGAGIKDWQKQLDEVIARLKVVNGYRDMMENPITGGKPGAGGKTGGDGMDQAAVASIIAEEGVRKRMAFEKNYAAQVAAEQGFSERYAAAIRTSNQLAQEARKSGLISEEDLIKQTAANEDARLQVLILSLHKQEGLAKQKGDLQAAEAARQKIALAEAERVAQEAIAKARIDSADSVSDKEFKQQLAIKVARIQEESLTEVQQLEAKLAEKQNVIDMAAAQGLISDEVWQAQSAMIFQQFETQKTAIADAETRKRFNIQKVYRQLDYESAGAFLGALSTMLVSHNRAAFEIGKQAAIAKTVMDTITGAQGAFSAYSSIPYVGPIIGAAAAAAAIVVGIARVQQIRSTQFGGGGGATPTYNAVPSTGIPTAPIGPDTATVPEPQQQQVTAKTPAPTQFNVTLVGKSFDADQVRDLMGLMKEQAPYGADITVTTVPG